MFGSRNFLFARTAAASIFGGKLFMWGANNLGNLGLGDTTNRSSPVQVGALTNWSKLATSGNHALSVKSTGELWSWGFNYYGGLGLGNSGGGTHRSSPVQVGALTNWKTPKAGLSNNSLCLKTDGTLWSWGNGNSGSLGLGNTTNYSSPKQVGASTNWVEISAGRYFTLAIDSTSKLFAWGKNNNGQLGLGDITNRSSPVQVGALTNWKTPSGGATTSLCLKTDGTLWAWGGNDRGQLGQGDTTNRSSPVQVGALTDWANISSGLGRNIMCVKTDGTLWAWGNGNNGNLGLGDTTYRSSPVQVGALTNWAAPFNGGYNAICLKTDGTLWSWGGSTAASAGALGLGNTTAYSSPKQIGSLTSWVVPAIGNTAVGCIQS